MCSLSESREGDVLGDAGEDNIYAWHGGNPAMVQLHCCHLGCSDTMLEKMLMEIKTQSLP